MLAVDAKTVLPTVLKGFIGKTHVCWSALEGDRCEIGHRLSCSEGGNTVYTERSSLFVQIRTPAVSADRYGQISVGH